MRQGRLLALSYYFHTTRRKEGDAGGTTNLYRQVQGKKNPAIKGENLFPDGRASLSSGPPLSRKTLVPRGKKKGNWG